MKNKAIKILLFLFKGYSIINNIYLICFCFIKMHIKLKKIIERVEQ